MMNLKKTANIPALMSIPFLAACLPLNFAFEKLRWIHKNPQVLFDLLTSYPTWLSAPLSDVRTCLIFFLVCLLFYLLWKMVPSQAIGNKLLYAARAIVRYRLAAALLAMGIIKLIPLQLPAPTLSDLHTNYGDFLPWKIYYLTNSAAKAHHQSYLGLIEILAAIALLFRKTASIGAGLALAFLTNVILVNIAYQLHDIVFAVYLFCLAFFVIRIDLARIFHLFFGKGIVHANRYRPIWHDRRLYNLRFTLKVGFVILIAFFLFQIYQAKQQNPFPFKADPGLKGIKGFYQVESFTLNNTALDAANEKRWRNVVFEAWNTMSIQQNLPQQVHVMPPKTIPLFDDSRYYEYAGSGGRTFYTYRADTINRQLQLRLMGGKQNLILHYKGPTKDTLYLSGSDEHRNIMKVKLVKKNKRYLIQEGRRKPIKI
ncbi:hypothetical protein RYH73_07450 [Olivibacter sp. CPCC 100613]|uniref:hypothetical protein n=1 Tax=Olivibacter sp. CPCC 100613 TaxID=3079931 RepID=UPI002FFD4E98